MSPTHTGMSRDTTIGRRGKGYLNFATTYCRTNRAPPRAASIRYGSDWRRSAYICGDSIDDGCDYSGFSSGALVDDEPTFEEHGLPSTPFPGVDLLSVARIVKGRKRSGKHAATQRSDPPNGFVQNDVPSEAQAIVCESQKDATQVEESVEDLSDFDYVSEFDEDDWECICTQGDTPSDTV